MASPLELSHHSVGSGPPLLVLHGLLGSARNWSSFARRFAGRHEVVLIDQRNHGDSPHDPDMDYRSLAGDVAALVRRRARAPVTVLGHSMGGKTAMALALLEPALLERLIVVDIAPVTYPDRFGPLIEALQGLVLEGLASRQAADAALSARIPDRALRAFLLQNLVRDEHGWRWRVDLDLIRGALGQVLAFPEIEARAGQPALFVRGGRSPSLDAEHQDAVRARFPASRIAEIPEAGHWPHAEAREHFEALVSAFLCEPS